MPSSSIDRSDEVSLDPAVHDLHPPGSMKSRQLAAGLSVLLCESLVRTCLQILLSSHALVRDRYLSILDAQATTLLRRLNAWELPSFCLGAIIAGWVLGYRRGILGGMVLTIIGWALLAIPGEVISPAVSVFLVLGHGLFYPSIIAWVGVCTLMKSLVRSRPSRWPSSPSTSAAFWPPRRWWRIPCPLP